MSTACKSGEGGRIRVWPGQHRLEFLYRPWPYLTVFALRALVLIAAFVGCVWRAVREFRKPAAS